MAASGVVNLLSLKIAQQATVYLDWTIIGISDNLSFRDIVEKIFSGDSINDVVPPQHFARELPPIESVNSTIFVGKTREDRGSIKLDQHLNIAQVIDGFGKFIHVELHTNTASEIVTNDSGSPQVNAFDILRRGAIAASANSGEHLYPIKKQSIRGDWKLHNDLIDALVKQQAYFTKGNILQGATYVSLCTTVLYNVLPHIHKFHRVQIEIPAFIIENFLSDAHDLKSQPYNQPEKSRHVFKKLSRELLTGYTHQLQEFVMTPFMQLERFKVFKSMTQSLAEALTNYADHLDDKNKQVQLQHAKETPSGKSTLISGTANYLRSVALVSRYKSLEKSLVNRDEYSQICLNEYAPSERRLHSKYVTEVSLPFCFEIMWCSQGNSKVWFIWKIPNISDKRDIQKTHALAKDIEHIYLEQYHSRIMKKKFLDHYGMLIKPNKCVSKSTVMQELYQDLTGDMSEPSTLENKDVRNRLKLYLQSEDPNMAVDLRQLNTGQVRIYDTFFESVEKYINENSINAAQDRRHDEIGRLAIAISMRDLIKQVSKTLDPLVPVPSSTYLRLQFWPKNKHFHSALQYTGRFNLRYRIQTRQLRGEHIDSHYANMIFRLLREFMVKYCDISTFISIDDKCHIKIGEPGTPVATAQRGRQLIVHGDGQDFTASDHDFTKFKLVPSAVLITEIPETIGGSWYKGALHVSLKDQVFQTSTPFRHATELKQILEDSGKANHILGIYSDGGPDHRLTYLSVQVSLIALFISLDLDMLLAARTAPLQSYRNPVERCMSTLNLGLQFVSISREKMDEDTEKIIKKANSLKALRRIATQIPAIKPKMNQSILQPIRLLNGVFQRLEYSGESVHIDDAATDDAVTALRRAVLDIDPHINFEKLQKAHLKNYTRLQDFMDKHCTIRHYIFCIQKCKDSECSYCTQHPPRMPSGQFSELHVLPDPIPQLDGDHYLPFDKVWGTTTTEDHRPSLRKKQDEQNKKQPRKRKTPIKKSNPDQDRLQPIGGNSHGAARVPPRMSSETVRLFTLCYLCGKPRCLYAPKKLTPEQIEEFDRAIEDVLYSCGAESPCAFLACEEDITCEDDVSIHYYSNRVRFPVRCFVCGDILSVFTQSCQSEGRPTCELCQTLPRFRTRGAKSRR